MPHIVAKAFAAGILGGLIYTAWRKQTGVDFRDQVVLITGGSRGLGLELARRWSKEGAKVAILARNAEDVRQAVKELNEAGEAFGVVCDITDSEQIRDSVEKVLAKWGRIDVLVNNAGIIQVGPLESVTHEDYQQAIATHLWGPIHLTDAVLPIMRRQGKGRIVNISSIGGRVSLPHLLPYSASKFALTGWSEGLTAALRPANILVTTVTPGIMRTGSPRNATFKGRHRDEYAWFSWGASMPVLATPSALAAERIIDGCRRGVPTVMVSAFSNVAARAHGLCPGFMTEILTLVNRWLPNAGSHPQQALKGS